MAKPWRYAFSWPLCFQLLEEDVRVALTSHMEQELSAYRTGAHTVLQHVPCRAPPRPLLTGYVLCYTGEIPTDVIAGLKTRLLCDPFYLEADDAGEVIAHYTKSRGDDPRHVRARHTTECLLAVYETPTGDSMAVVGSGRARDRHTLHGMDVGSVSIRRRDKLKAKARRNPRWIPDSEQSHCMHCLDYAFWSVGTADMTRHHCRACGWVVCQKCSPADMTRQLDRYVTADGIQDSSVTGAGPQRVCRSCSEALGARCLTTESPLSADAHCRVSGSMPQMGGMLQQAAPTAAPSSDGSIDLLLSDGLAVVEEADAAVAGVLRPASPVLQPSASSSRRGSPHVPAVSGLPLSRASIDKLRQLVK
jgi:hypothetical protein